MRTILKILKLRGRDWSGYFLAFELMKNGSYKGLQVTHWDDKKKPDKAKQTFVPSSHVGGNGWKEIRTDEVPDNVNQRFAETEK
jgi:hypothetical protein